MHVILGASFILALANYILSPMVNITLLFIADLALWIAANIALSRAIRRRSARLGTELYQ